MEIRRTPHRFGSIFLIVALGVAFFSGIRATEPDMRLSADAYYDHSALMDIRVLGDLGMTAGDVEAIREVEGVQVLHRGKPKTLTRRQWAWVKRRQAVEPVIGHLKDDCRLRRCHLKGAQGDALHVIACAAGYNLRWLLRWIAFLWARILGVAAEGISDQRSTRVAVAV